jgi:hypothetical protein
LILESDHWLVLRLLFFHLFPEFDIFVAWIFLRSSVVSLNLSACNYIDLMALQLFHGTLEMLEWTLSWDQSSCERDMPVGTSNHTDRASDLLRRESECCC